MLRVLADQERHGYEIKKQVERILGGRSINNNVLYPALRKYEDQGAIERAAVVGHRVTCTGSPTRATTCSRR